ncbi:HU family DNA-binding protein [Paenibacillus alba]|uniref:HU family DNA-binding protein n=1 Tax=Paenibacillus alba TaxID=1197127 RepID=A0ABU6GG08_9BACL|nr:HU family DNA-binding protein [Paenibacillus alba]MEC0232544.1 HU family DNA-binding protein [Paenibacillus alba]
MNKQGLIDEMASKTKVPKKLITRLIDTALESIAEALQSGEKVQILNFGTFDTRIRSARNGINPTLLTQLIEQGIHSEDARAQASVAIAETRVLDFKAADKLKEVIRDVKKQI